MNDTEAWCDEHLSDLYDVGMFDDEQIHIAVWDAFDELTEVTVLLAIDDAEERAAMYEELCDAAEEWFRSHHEAILLMLPVEEPTDLLARPQIEQHSAEWYAHRANSLTASEFANILDGRRGALLRSKSGTGAPSSFSSATVAIAQPDGDMVATSWGHRFEPITRAIYELEEGGGVGTVNDTLGRFNHATIPWLSASPDGVVLSGPRAGRLVEIKSPKTRQPGEFVPSDYYVQMQIQMEVCDREAADFVEAQFCQVPVFHYMEGGWFTGHQSDKMTEGLRTARWMGVLQVWGRKEDSASWVYRYTPPVRSFAADPPFLTPAPSPSEGLSLLEQSVWWLAGYFPRTVIRNTGWWETIGKPAATAFWEAVLVERAKQRMIAETGSGSDDESEDVPMVRSAFRSRSSMFVVKETEETTDENRATE